MPMLGDDASDEDGLMTTQTSNPTDVDRRIRSVRHRTMASVARKAPLDSCLGVEGSPDNVLVVRGEGKCLEALKSDIVPAEVGSAIPLIQLAGATRSTADASQASSSSTADGSQRAHDDVLNALRLQVARLETVAKGECEPEQILTALMIDGRERAAQGDSSPSAAWMETLLNRNDEAANWLRIQDQRDELSLWRHKAVRAFEDKLTDEARTSSEAPRLDGLEPEMDLPEKHVDAGPKDEFPAERDEAMHAVANGSQAEAELHALLQDFWPGAFKWFNKGKENPLAKRFPNGEISKPKPSAPAKQEEERQEVVWDFDKGDWSDDAPWDIAPDGSGGPWDGPTEKARSRKRRLRVVPTESNAGDTRPEHEQEQVGQGDISHRCQARSPGRSEDSDDGFETVHFPIWPVPSRAPITPQLHPGELQEPVGIEVSAEARDRARPNGVAVSLHSFWRDEDGQMHWRPVPPPDEDRRYCSMVGVDEELQIAAQKGLEERKTGTSEP